MRTRRAPCLDTLRGILQRVPSSSMRRLLAKSNTTLVFPGTWQMWGEDGTSWLSLDTPQALAEAHAHRQTHSLPAASEMSQEGSWIG